MITNITRHALIQRINRKLRPDYEMLRRTRGERARFDLGDFYIHNFRFNWINQTHVDPEVVGRELGVLLHYETVANDELTAA